MSLAAGDGADVAIVVNVRSHEVSGLRRNHHAFQNFSPYRAAMFARESKQQAASVSLPWTEAVRPLAESRPGSQRARSSFCMEPIENAVHLCVDMQRIFASGGIWETPWMMRVLPVIISITARYPERTIFTRFITPNSPEEAWGRWKSYFEHWKIATRQSIGGTQLDLVPELVRFTPPATIINKPAYSAFFRSPLARILHEKGIATVVISGAETDVCVLATVLDAVDFGLRVVLVDDALCSSSDEGHDALMTMYRLRFHEQIDLIKSAELAEVWKHEYAMR